MGSGSVALPQPDGLAESDQPAADVDTIPSQISELVRRIDKFQSSRSQQPAIRSAPRDSFLFETGPDGVICWVDGVARGAIVGLSIRSEEHTSELQSLMRISYAVFCLEKKNN